MTARIQENAVGYYLGVPVVVVQDHGDGWVTALWPDRENPGRARKKAKPFTYRKLEWWRLWRDQVTFTVELPPLQPLTLAPHPLPDGGA